MLHHCASTILTEANRYIQAKLNIEETAISLAILGRYTAESTSQKGIIMRLVDITSVEVCSNPNEYLPQGDGFIIRKKPEAFNLYFLFSTDHSELNLVKNLEFLAYIAAFFQNKSHFDICNTPILHGTGIENFSAELVKMTPSEKSMLWRSLDIPYTPSLLYRVGLIFIGDTTVGLKVISAFSSLKK